MPVTYQCDATDRIMVWSVSDPVTNEDWSRALDRSEHDPEVRGTSPIGIIVDIRLRREFQTQHALQVFARSLRARLRRLRIRRMPVAVVVSSAVAHGMTRMTEGYVGDSLDIQIFREVDAAREWVQVRTRDSHIA